MNDVRRHSLTSGIRTSVYELAAALTKKNEAPVLAESSADPLMNLDEKPDRYAVAICIGGRLDFFARIFCGEGCLHRFVPRARNGSQMLSECYDV